MLSFVAKSNLFTKAVAAKSDPRQEIPSQYAIPNAETRLLLAELIFEEAMETVKALGCYVTDELIVQTKYVKLGQKALDIDEIIDGACDTIYVATGCLMAVGAPDLPHLQEVCEANDRKFPGGTATINPESGKYLKPKGWKGPNHASIRGDQANPGANNLGRLDLRRYGKILLSTGGK